MFPFLFVFSQFKIKLKLIFHESKSFAGSSYTSLTIIFFVSQQVEKLLKTISWKGNETGLYASFKA